jgi:serine-type D-Ala-D-Ala carboxypeptidase (penicillin-binding protein 5/6)
MWFLLRPYQVFLVAGIVLVMAASSLASSPSEAVVVSYVPTTLAAVDLPPELSAEAFAIFDPETGTVIAAENSDEVLPIASVTKLLTAATVLRTVDRSTTYTIEESDVAMHGRAGRLEPGEMYDAYELLFPLLLESSNDAAAVYERGTEGDIIRRMNGYAKELGARHLVVTDASGLSDTNQASVRDLVSLTSALYTKEPHVFDISRLSKRAGPYVGWSNNSPVFDATYRGGKHGFTEAAGRTIVALFTESFASGEKTVGYVLLGSADLKADMALLRTYVGASVTLK